MKILFVTNEGASCESCFSLDREIQFLQYLRSFCAGLQQTKQHVKFCYFFSKWSTFVGLNVHWKVTEKEAHGPHRYYFPFEKDVALHLCQVWLKLAQCFWRWKVDRQWDRQTDGQQAIRKTHLTFSLGELKTDYGNIWFLCVTLVRIWAFSLSLSLNISLKFVVS